MKRKGLILAMFVMPNSTLIMHMSSMSKVCGIVFRAVGRSENPVGGGHCALNGVLRGYFPGNQDGAVNLKSELIFIKL